MNGPGLEFEWDEANKGHIARHGVTPKETEEALLLGTLEIEMQVANASDGEERLLQLGETAQGRILQIVTTWRGGKVRVISAWDAPSQLEQYYFAEMRRRYGNIEDSEV
ncbi:MAG TPA: BrnT family toxin [Terracidiphilus sp.]|jgi:hypothetical protein